MMETPLQVGAAKNTGLPLSLAKGYVIFLRGTVPAFLIPIG